MTIGSRIAVVLGVATLLCCVVTPAEAQPATRRVLLLHSFEPEFAPYDAFVGSFRTELAERAAAPVEFFDVSLQTARFNEPVEPGPIIDYLHAIFAAHPADLVVPIGGPAVTFVEQHRDQLFPSTPMLFTAVDQRLVDRRVLRARDAAVPVANDPAKVIEGIQRILPETTHIFIVIGTSPVERYWRDELERDVQQFQDRLTFTWSDGLSFAELLSHTASLPRDSAIFYVLWSVDANGVPQTESRALAGLHEVANAPIFGLHSSQLGKGIVGGPLMDIDALSRNAATSAARMLRGDSLPDIRPSAQQPGPPLFDWRELRRWGIAESRLPTQSVVRFREPSTWERYRWLIVGGASVSVGEGLLIVALVANRRKRRQAEAALAQLSRTLLKAQEDERAWVAHELQEDLCQRLVALSVQLQMMAHTVSPSSAHDVHALSADVDGVVAAAQALSRRLHNSTLPLLGLAKALAAFCRELAAQYQVDVQVREEGDVDAIPADQARALFRVLQEALRNAVTHSGADTIRVTLSGDADVVALTVADNGAGFDVHKAMRHGLGLLAMQERVHAVGGTITIDSEPAEGSTVRAAVPRQGIPVAVGVRSTVNSRSKREPA